MTESKSCPKQNTWNKQICPSGEHDDYTSDTNYLYIAFMFHSSHVLFQKKYK